MLVGFRNEDEEPSLVVRYKVVFPSLKESVLSMKLPAMIAGILMSLASLGTAARADLIVTIDSASVPAGGIGTVDVWLSFDPNSSYSTDYINNFSFQLQITNNGVDGTQLAFDPNQDFTAVEGNSQYLFYNDSFGAVGTVSESNTGYPSDTVTVLDSTADGNTVPLSAGSSYLLAALTVTTSTGAPPNPTDSFSISLIPGSGSGSYSAGTNTVFNDIDFNTFTEISAAPYSSSPGTATITSSAVPEPGSIVAGATALLIVSAARYARTRAIRPLNRPNILPCIDI
jgi:hypothetical protein